jgi:hypothetical protein
MSRVWQTLDVRCADDFVLLGCEPKFFKNLVPSTTSKDQGVTNYNTHTLSLFFFFFFFFLYVYKVKSTIWKTLFFTNPFVSMCQQWIDEKQVLTHQETHLM